MKFTRRSILKGTASAAAIIAAPTIFIPNEAFSAPWISKGGTIKVGVLFSQSGSLAVIENDSTQVVLYAISNSNYEVTLCLFVLYSLF